MKTLTFLFTFLLFINTGFSLDTPQQEDKMVAVVLMMDDGDDQEIISTIYTSLMAAEKVAKILEVELIAEDEVNDDVFVFSLKTEQQKEIALKMFDEEGYELAANRVLKLESGNNYNALNVKTLEDGTYKFQITDETGAEKTTTVTINRK
ncbi:T9SS C-terminal target domain-containing protein [Aureispira anguillae]|uniref:T9SS C-terminal target domain-containing protein n=1 Tax=Aureispira anguillae TaxID=2864201 RepID=A0A916DTV5_9BACT|nr:T9SS C-terminal target domain-containing protein [Aureispira anguillae]BDS11771.1 T9SS C-terminal target domain-containing protein [Aureispira anguillae]